MGKSQPLASEKQRLRHAEITSDPIGFPVPVFGNSTGRSATSWARPARLKTPARDSAGRLGSGSKLVVPRPTCPECRFPTELELAWRG